MVFGSSLTERKCERTHVLSHRGSPRGSPVSQEGESRKCATARKSRLATPNFFHVHTPASTLPTRVNFENVPWGSDRAGGGRCATRACCIIVLNL
eukprot:2971451-Prymnesium_polylepis.1